MILERGTLVENVRLAEARSKHRPSTIAEVGEDFGTNAAAAETEVGGLEVSLSCSVRGGQDAA